MTSEKQTFQLDESNPNFNPTRHVTPEGQIVNPGPSQQVWAAALARSGIDPSTIAEYNTGDKEEPAK